MEKESFTTLMETSMKEIGKTTRQTVKEPMSMPMDPSMSENGKMTSNTAKERRHGKTVVNTMVIMLIQRSKAKVFTFGQTETRTLENGEIIQLMAMVSICGLMVESTVVNGAII